MGAPIIYRQIRPGKDGVPFQMLKFRTMVDRRESEDSSDNEELRITKLGNFLRNTSIDELPELWNVLKNDMSLVGPRPLLMEYLSLYSKEQARRHKVKPGITGWAQINGRSSLSWEKKFRADVWYVDNQSVMLDLKILLLTVKKVLMRDNVVPESAKIMPKFTGSGHED